MGGIEKLEHGRCGMKSWASLVLRLGVGPIFMAHGAQKAWGAFGGPGIKGFSEMLGGLGFPLPEFWAYLAAYVELLGGLCLIVGFLTTVSCLPLLVLISVATIKVHLTNGFFLSNGGYEYNLVIASALVALVLLGPGDFSITKKI